MGKEIKLILLLNEQCEISSNNSLNKHAYNRDKIYPNMLVKDLRPI